MKFTIYKFKKAIEDTLNDLHFFVPTEVQKKVIPEVLKGKNVVVESQTGSGKTHSFLLPIFERLKPGNFTQVLIISPTRELGFQLKKRVEEFEKYTKTSSALLVSGSHKDGNLGKINPNIVIGTIGKIIDYVKLGLVKLNDLKTVVIDEADMIFSEREDDGFVSLMNVLKTKQILLFSATLNLEIKKFLKKYLTSPIIIKLKTNTVKHLNNYFVLDTGNKEEILSRILQEFMPFLCIIFASTIVECKTVEKILLKNNYDCSVLTGDLEARKRETLLKRIKNHEITYLVATDLASRGLDIREVSHVVNFSLPNNKEYFYHRIGRAQRYKDFGTTYTIYRKEDLAFLNTIDGEAIKKTFLRLVNGGFILEKPERKTKSETMRPEERHLRSKNPLGKKVKPNYKKDRETKIKKAMQKAKHAYITLKYHKGERK